MPQDAASLKRARAAAVWARSESYNQLRCPEYNSSVSDVDGQVARPDWHVPMTRAAPFGGSWIPSPSNESNGWKGTSVDHLYEMSDLPCGLKRPSLGNSIFVVER